ncbi:DHA2 family efflux MFS transporter permease subunit [Salicibibacter cibi]|uniref:DHA2 family efflux MFS transporter permease subunit n=1 Tax=Salicibibacter cibi TaxID=2743001 RepID=A0A7T6Z909_9BACI|nr:DHA2 family efflux MFS transporter permease subunit [Salicibibacter cibi]QQK79156.1 DHA2 family efflux MFS transporter permease subunit [Salicibibacter cibi]
MHSNKRTKIQRRLIVAITLSGSFLSVLMQFLLITAFPRIMVEFDVNASEVQGLTTIYMLMIAILIPMTAFLIDTFKTRTLMMSAMFLFSIGTLFGLLAPSFEMLMVGRIFQGAGSGMLMPLMQTLLLLIYPREKRGFAMGMAGLVINVAPAIGPPISGVIVNAFEWRAIFLLTLLIAVAIMILMFLFMRNVTERRDSKIDVLSILLSTVGFGGILYGFNTEGVAMIGIGSITLILFVIRQFRLEQPTLELRVLKTPIFALVAMVSILSFSLLISIETILPMYVQNVQEHSALYAGIVVFPGAMTLAVMSLLAGKLFDKYGGKRMALIGFILIATSTLSYFFLLDVHTSLAFVSVLFMFAMGGVALINMPIMTTGINALPDALVAHGTAIINTARQFGGSLGLTFIISFISRQATVDDAADALHFLNGVSHAFFVAFLFAFVGLLLSFMLKKE